MAQAAIIKRIVSPSVAEISLLRQLECALGCKDCEGCMQKPKDEILALADNAIGAAPGDVVEVTSAAGSQVSAALLVYLLPCLTLAAGYLIGAGLSWSEPVCVLAAFVGLAVGFLPARLIDRAIRRRGQPEFTVLSVVGGK